MTHDNTQSNVVEEAAEIGALLRFARGRCDAGSPAVKAINKALDLLGRTALTSSDAVLEERWQPIETVPDDGLFDVWYVVPESDKVTGFALRRTDVLRKDGKWFATTFEQQHFTHWRHSPNPPLSVRETTHDDR